MEVRVIPKTKKDKPRVCAYARVSTDKAEQEYSFAVQSEYWNNKFSTDPNVEYIGLFSDEGVSGKRMSNRKGLNEILTRVENGEVDEVYTKSISRFARNYVELMRVIREFRDRGIPVIFEKENINTLDPKCGLILSVMASLAEEELNSMSKNQKWAARKRFSNGSIELTKMLGYTYAKGTLTVIPEEAEIVKEIFADYLSGLGTYAICKKLERERRPTVHGEFRWNKNSIMTILKNEKYTGNCLLQKATYSLGVRQINDGQVDQYYIENSHEAIISQEDFDRVQYIIKKRKEKYRPHIHKPVGEPYPLSGKIKCGECGHSYKRKVNGRGQTYECTKWVCPVKDRRGKSYCPVNDIKNDVIEKLLLDAYNEAIKQRGAVYGTADLQDKLNALLSSERELKELKMRGYISETQYTTQADRLIGEITDLENAIKTATAKNMSNKKYTESAEFNETVADFLVKATVKNWTVTFEFKNGAVITKSYTNGRAGNVNGKLCKRKT